MKVEDWLGEDNQIGIDIWSKKYKHGDETFDEWLNRVSGGDQKIQQLIIEKKFLFGGRILANRGLSKDGEHVTYSNCYVVSPPEDTIESIFECAKKLARTYSYGGGCGVDISKLAPRGAKVNNTAKETSGAVSFMDLYSMVTGLIGQNGRRGALMISLDCHHPDIEEFIGIKSDLNRITKANVSIRITDDFMLAVRDDTDFELSFTREATGETVRKVVRAKELFRKIAEMNWRTAEPGMLFWDRITKHNLLSNTPEFEFAGTNPCAEEPLPAGGSCLLGSINLSEFVTDSFTDVAQFDFSSFSSVIQTSVFAMNDVLDEGLDLHPLREQRNSVSKWRQIGIGVMGVADMLIKLGITYGSQEAIELCSEISSFMINSAVKASCEFAKNNGKHVSCSNDILHTDFYASCIDSDIDDLIEKSGIANSQLLTIAPTGTLSTMLGISGGIEPIFANSYSRKTESLHGKDVYYKVYTPIVKEYMDRLGLIDDGELPGYFVTASDIHYQNRINMQAAWQQHIDASISSTVNVPNSFTVEEVENLYMSAWKAGLKGITIYRDGCERSGVLITDTTSRNDAVQGLKRGDIIDVSNSEVGLCRHLMTGCGTLHCSAYFDPDTGDLLETFFNKGSQGGCEKNLVGLSRMVSIAARSGVPISVIVDQLKSVGLCSSYTSRTVTKHDTSKGTSCCTAIANALLDMWTEIQENLGLLSDEDDNRLVSNEDDNRLVSNEDDNRLVSNESMTDKPKCPECGELLRFEGGCNACPNCGWSKCL